MKYDKEKWMPIIGYEGIYEVSDLGRIKSLSKITNHGHYRRERVFKGSLNTDGYLRVSLRNKGIIKGFFVHRLVANAFILNSKNKPTVNHINGLKTDNRLMNLEWATRSENSKHAYNTGLQKGRKGEKHHGNKLTKENVLSIRVNIENLSSYDIAKRFNVSQSLISMIINRKIWNHI